MVIRENSKVKIIRSKVAYVRRGLSEKSLLDALDHIDHKDSNIYTVREIDIDYAAQYTDLEEDQTFVLLKEIREHNRESMWFPHQCVEPVLDAENISW